MKYIPFFLLIFLIYSAITNALKSQDFIPDDAIRVRVIANSNSEYDQKIKLSVKETVTKDMYNILKDVKGIENARNAINKHLSLLGNNIDSLLKRENYQLGYKINFGYNYFPQKEYKGITYNAGYYESLVITLGEGKGDNWWCVLFPPICMIEAQNSSEVEYTTLVKDLFSKYF